VRRVRRPIEVLIREGQPEGTAVGWLPDESCSNVMAEFCPSALLFCSRAHLDEWRTGQATAPGAALDIEKMPSVAGLSGISSFREGSRFAQSRS
jgi:hypothetical protein